MTSATSPAAQPSAPAPSPSPAPSPTPAPSAPSPAAPGAHLSEQLAAIDWLLARLPAAARVLDIGSGTGRPTADLIAGQGHRVTGCDVSAAMVELAAAQVPAAHFAMADIRELHFAPGSWEAVTAFFPPPELDRAELDAALARIADWLAPGGYVVLATVPGAAAFGPAASDPVASDPVASDSAASGPAGEAEGCPVELFTQWLRASGLKVLHRQTTALHPELPGTDSAERLFLYARKPGGPAVPAHTLAAPYPHPSAYRGPRRPARPDRAAAEPRVERHDIAPMVEALAGNTTVLHLGGDEALVRALSTRGVTVLPEDVGQLPLPDAAVDAAVAVRVLHGTEDPRAVVAELVRVVDRSHPQARIVLLQGAPDNGLVALWNRVCAPLTGEQPDHQGFLLAQAAEVLAEHGFDDLAWHRVPVRLLFPEGGPDLRARAAADVLAGLWHTGDPRLDRLPEALLPVLAEHFRTAEESADDTGADSVNDDGVMLVAAPRYHH